jgi:hypothetical protein
MEQIKLTYLTNDHFRYWWLRINALGESGDWIELEKFSKGKKAPVGMEVSICFLKRKVFCSIPLKRKDNSALFL